MDKRYEISFLIRYSGGQELVFWDLSLPVVHVHSCLPLIVEDARAAMDDSCPWGAVTGMPDPCCFSMTVSVVR